MKRSLLLLIALLACKRETPVREKAVQPQPQQRFMAPQLAEQSATDKDEADYRAWASASGRGSAIDIGTYLWIKYGGGQADNQDADVMAIRASIIGGPYFETANKYDVERWRAVGSPGAFMDWYRAELAGCSDGALSRLVWRVASRADWGDSYAADTCTELDAWLKVGGFYPQWRAEQTDDHGQRKYDSPAWECVYVIPMRSEPVAIGDQPAKFWRVFDPRMPKDWEYVYPPQFIRTDAGQVVPYDPVKGGEWEAIVRLGCWRELQFGSDTSLEIGRTVSVR